MKKRADKRKDGEKLRERVLKAPHLFVAGFEKLTVSQDYDLRKTIRGAGGDYEVVKNTVAAKASEGTPAAPVLSNLRGMTSVAFTNGDPVALAKALTAYAKTNANFTFKAGMVEGRVIDVKAIQELATMPPREEIIAKLLYMINAPAQRLLTAINGTGRNVAAVIDQGVQEGKFPG